MAIHPLLKSQRLLEVAVGMTLGTVNACVFSFQGKLRIRMVEMLVHRGKRNLLPS